MRKLHFQVVHFLKKDIEMKRSELNDIGEGNSNAYVHV